MEMNAWNYKAVTLEGLIYCVECLPAGYTADHDDVRPIFVSDEWDYYPTCDRCGREHDYVGLTDDGQKYQARFV